MDFILMLTRNDRTVEDAEELLDDVLACGVGHVGFKDIGVPAPVMRRLVERIRQARAVSYLEVVSTTPQAVERSLSAARDLGVDRVLGGTDLDAASRLLGDLARYHPFPGRPVGHPAALAGSPALVAEHCREARRRGCGGVDLLAYRATEAEPLDLVRAAAAALDGGRLIVAGSVNSAERISALSNAGAHAFTIGSAVFDGSFSPSKGGLRSQIRDVLDACRRQKQAVT
jgi:NAD(P)H-dependent flavin oxidoreductase YrpB (nitropropane dioxygenase family)